MIPNIIPINIRKIPKFEYPSVSIFIPRKTLPPMIPISVPIISIADMPLN